MSEDIDPTNTDAVFWSLAYRSNPVEDVHVVPHRSAGHGPKSGLRNEDSSLLIDATLKHATPPLALPAQRFMERARAIWEELGLPALTPQPPWHGYSLGDWSANWDVYAQRAVAGDWEAERRGNLRAPPRRLDRRRRRCGRWKPDLTRSLDCPPRLPLRPRDQLFDLAQIEPISDQAHASSHELLQQVAASKRPVIGMRSGRLEDAENI